MAETSNETAEAQIRALIDERIEAVRAKYVNGALAATASDIRLFDVVNPLQSVGSGANKSRVEAWLSSFQDPIGFEMRGPRITTGDDVAFSHSLNRYSGAQTGGA